MSSFVLDPAVHHAGCVPRMTRTVPKRQYKDKHYEGGETEWKKKLELSSTVYVGNLSCYTNEYQLFELFGRCGSIKRIIMGLDKIKKTPCGFCFVEFDEREGALKCVNYLNNTRLDGRDMKIDIDAGFIEGRQYGRGTHGGQISDERRLQRESSGASNQRGGYHGGGGPGAAVAGPILTRSITIVACLAMISLFMIATMTPPVQSVERNFRPLNLYVTNTNRQNALLMNTFQVRQAQLGETRAQFEKAFAQFLVSIMKAAKPTLLKAFMTATLADKQLKDIAIAIFFNNTESDGADN